MQVNKRSHQICVQLCTGVNSINILLEISGLLEAGGVVQEDVHILHLLSQFTHGGAVGLGPSGELRLGLGVGLAVPLVDVGEHGVVVFVATSGTDNLGADFNLSTVSI